MDVFQYFDNLMHHLLLLIIASFSVLNHPEEFNSNNLFIAK